MSNSLEYEIADYLVHHKEGLVTKFASHRLAINHPELLGLYKECLLDELQSEIITNLDLNYIDVCDIITEEFCERFLGENFFKIEVING